MSDKPDRVHEILANRCKELEGMLRRCHAAIRCDDNERVARGLPVRWATLDAEAHRLIGDAS